MEIKLPVKWLKEKKIKISVGDARSTGSHSWVISTVDGSERVNNKNLTAEGWITSFADRENTGEQPVADWVPVCCTLNGGSTVIGVGSNFRWWRSCNDEAMARWKPHAEVLMEMYTAEQSAKSLAELPPEPKRAEPPLVRELFDEVPDGSKIVSMIEYNGQIIMCTGTRVYRMNDNGEFVTVKFKKG